MLTNKVDIHTTITWYKKIYEEHYNSPFDYKNLKHSEHSVIKQKERLLLHPEIEKLINASLMLEYYNKMNSQNKTMRNMKIFIYLAT